MDLGSIIAISQSDGTSFHKFGFIMVEDNKSFSEAKIKERLRKYRELTS